MPKSKRKQRQQARKTPEQVLIECVEEFVSERAGVTLETHTAGYWNEIGLRLTVPDEFTTEAIEELGDALYAVIVETTSEREPDWAWMVAIYRGDEMVEDFRSQRDNSQCR